jgi:Protein of unknown function (DUF3617)
MNGTMTAADRAEMEKALAEMPPDMRAKAKAQRGAVEAAMKDPIVKRICITKEDLSKISGSFDRPRGDDGTCSQTIVKSTSSVQEMRIDCRKTKETETTSTSTIRTSAANPQTVTTEAILAAGANEMKQKMTGKWLGADCGSVKP